MADENVEIVRRMWDAFLSGGVEPALSYVADDIEWDGTNLPDGRVGRGHQAVLDHVAHWGGSWDEWTVEVEQIREAPGERVLVIIRERGRSSSGLEMDERHAELYTVNDGKVVRRLGFSDPRDALAQAGAAAVAPAIPKTNVEIALAVADAWNRGDYDAFLALWDEEAEFHPLRAQLEGKSYETHDGLKRFMVEMTEQWDGVRFEIDEARDAGEGEQVVGIGRFRARGRASGVDVNVPLGVLARIKRGKVVYLRLFSDPADALAAASVPE